MHHSEETAAAWPTLQVIDERRVEIGLLEIRRMIVVSNARCCRAVVLLWRRARLLCRLAVEIVTVLDRRREREKDANGGREVLLTSVI